MGPSNSTIKVGPLMVYSVNEDGTTELLGTLGEIEPIEIEKCDREEILNMGGTITFSAKLTLRSRIRLRLWIFRSKIKLWLWKRKMRKGILKFVDVKGETINGE